MATAFVVIASFLLFGVTGFNAEIADSTICNLNVTTTTTNVVNEFAGYRYLHVIGLDNPKSWKCEWQFKTGAVSSTILDLTRVILAPGDELVVRTQDGNRTDIVYNKTGNSEPGLLFLNSNSTILLTLDKKASKADRTFEILFSQNYDHVPLGQARGSLSFPLNQVPKVFDQPRTFQLQPGSQYSDRKIMLRFLSTTSIDVTMDGKKINTTDGDVYLAKNDFISFEFICKDCNKPVVMDYWLVTDSCSQEIELTDKSPTAQIKYPDEEYRKSHLVTEIICAQIFKMPKGKFTELSFDPKMVSLPNPGDLLTTYELPSFKSQVAISSLYLPYFTGIHTFLDQEKLLVMYDSPFGSPSKNKPLPITLALTNNATLELNDANPSKVFPIRKTSDYTKLIINVYSMSNQNIMVLFDKTKIGPNNMKIAIFKTDYTTPNIEPVVVLDRFDVLPPAIMVKNTVMRVELSGKLEEMNLTFKHVDPSDCYSISSPTFHVKNSKQNCSWFIPQGKSSNFTVLSAAFLKLPQNTALKVQKLSEKSAELADIKGPYNDAYLPDFAANSSYAYLIDFVSHNASAEGTEIFIAEKSDFIQYNTVQDEDKKSFSFISINYPGNYPVGYIQKSIIGKNGSKNQFLITINDFQLADNHQLTFFSAKNISFTSKDKLNQISDFVLTVPLWAVFDTEKSALFSRSGHGFDVQMTYFSCGGLVDLTKENKPKMIEFKYNASEHSAYPICIWKIIGDSKATNLSLSVMNFNVSLQDQLSNTKAAIHVYDTISLRNSSIHFAKCNQTEGLCLNSDPKTGLKGYFKGSISHAIILYDFSESLNTKKDLSVNITIEKTACAKTKYNLTYCNNGERCITDLMACDHQNDCGDWSDEIYCSGWIPPPPPPNPADHSSGGGVNVWVVIFILMPLGAILGILGYVFLPRLLVNIRHGRYSEFRSDLSEVS